MYNGPLRECRSIIRSGASRLTYALSAFRLYVEDWRCGDMTNQEPKTNPTSNLTESDKFVVTSLAVSNRESRYPYPRPVFSNIFGGSRSCHVEIHRPPRLLPRGIDFRKSKNVSVRYPPHYFWYGKRRAPHTILIRKKWSRIDNRCL